MKIIVFGATGTVGRHVVSQALEQGYEVTAFCRNPQSLETVKSSGLTCHAGDVFDPKSVAEAVRGQDAVCVLLGSGKSRKGTVRSEGTRNVIQAMETHGVKRLVCQTTLGAGESWGNLNFFWRRIMFGWFLKEVFQDHEVQEALVKQSNLDWTIVRPAAFRDKERTGQYRHGFSATEKGLTLKIGRADVADFVLKQIRDRQYLHQAAGLSY